MAAGTSAPTTAAIYPSSGNGSSIPQIGTEATASADPSSPTGGYVNINPNVGQGIDTSENALLPGGFTLANTGVAQQSTSTAAPSSYVSAGESQMQGVTNWNVAPNQTVAGQYASLTGEGGGQINPAIQQAEQASIRSNAAHGGANDLMSSEAAQEAGSNLALQVASTDAATNAAAASQNASAANTAAQNLNQFVENAQLSSQNFNEGLATLNAQTNQQLDLITAGVNANTANTETSLNASIANTQASLNSTLAAMGQQYNYTTAENYQQAGIQSQQAWTNYGMQVRLNYLSSVQSQAGALQQEIANISSNPNITSAQAQGAMSDAINQFNTLVSTLGSYSAAMMPTSSTGTSAGTYNSAAYNYSYIDSSSFPGPSTGGGSSSSNFFLNPSALSSGSTGAGSVAPINNPYQTSTSGGGAGGGGSGAINNAVQTAAGISGGATSYSGNSAGGLISGATAQISGNNLTDANGNSLGSLSDVAGELAGLVTGGASAIAGWAQAHPVLSTALGLLVPGAGTVVTVAKIINWIHNKMSNTSPIPTGAGGADAISGDVGSYANQMSEYAGETGNSNSGGNISPLGGKSIFTDDDTTTQSGQQAVDNGTGAPLAGELDNGNFNDGSGSAWDGSFEGGGDDGGGGGYGGGGGGGAHFPGELGGDAAIE
jgi:hypothetical protein